MIINKPSIGTIASAIIVALVLTVSINQCNKLKQSNKKLEVANQNIAALNDTIRIVKTRNNKAEADKLAFLTDKVSSLEKLNTDLAIEVKNTKGNVSTIIKETVRLQHDTVPLIVKTDVKDSNVVSSFNYDSVYSKGNSRLLRGYTAYNLKTGESSGKLTKDSTSLSFVTGIKDLDKGKPTIFIRSDYPGFEATSIEGAVLDPSLFKTKNKQHLLSLGFHIGYSPLAYDLTKKTFGLKNQVTAGIGLNIRL